MSAATENKKRKMSLSAKIILGVGAFLLAATAAIGTTMMIKSVNSMKEVLQGKMLDIANSASSMLNGDEIAQLERDDLGGEIYFYDEEQSKPAEERHQPRDGVISVTADEAYTTLNALADGERTTDQYEITGFVVSILDTYNEETHDSISFTIGETSTSTNLINVIDYKFLSDNKAEYSKIKSGTKVIVNGFLEKRIDENNAVVPVLVHSSSIFEKNIDILATFKTSNERSNAEFAYIYLLKKVDDKFFFSLDPSDDPGLFLEEETIHTPALARAFEGYPSVDDQSYGDRWGKYYTAYSPVFDTSKNVISVVAVDVNASWYDKLIASDAIAIGIVGVLTIVFGILLALIVTSNIRKRFEILSIEMNELEGDVKELLKEISSNEEINVDVKESDSGSTIGDLRDRIQVTQTELRKYIKYVRERAYIDSLTGLGNRTAYFEKVNYINKDFSRNFTVCLFDINGLKQINDTFGHETGDISIIATAKILLSVFEANCCYRIGGDEFVVILDYSNKERINKVFAKLFENVKEHKQAHPEYPFDLSISFGYSPVNFENDKEYMDVFRRADKEMYIAKKEFHKNDDK